MVFQYGPLILENMIRATRLIKGYEHYNYPERFQELNLPRLYYRRCNLIQVFRIIKQIGHINSDSFFDLNLGITRKITFINCKNQDAIAHIRFMFFLIEL